MAKRSGQWFGGTVVKTIPSAPVIADVVQLLEPADSLESVRALVFERCVLTLSVRRITASDVSELLWMVYKGRVADGSVIPLEALNPRSASNTTLAHASILQFGALSVPAIVRSFDSAGAFVTSEDDGALIAHQVDFDVKRSLSRNTEGIFLTMGCNSASTCNVTVAWRTYYTYA